METSCSGPWGMIQIIESTTVSLLNVNIQQYMDLAKVQVLGGPSSSRTSFSSMEVTRLTCDRVAEA